MKHPLSTEYVLENGNMNPTTFLWSFEENGQLHDGSNYQLNNETKKVLFSLCEVCNIQLNTAAQAEVHYSGKSHLKRMKQLNNGKPPPPHPASPSSHESTGTTCHSTTLSALVQTPTLMMQPSLDIKSFMSFPVDNSPAVGLFPNFNTMDPVQKAVINHTFGVSIPPKKKQVISCNVCQLRFNSDSQAEAHYKGSKHAKKLKALEATKSKQKSVSSKDSAKVITSPAIPVTVNNKSGQHSTFLSWAFLLSANVLVTWLGHCWKQDTGKSRTNGSSQPSGTDADPFTSKLNATLPTILSETPSKSTNGTSSLASESEEEKAKKLLYCSLCKVAVNSLSQLEAHNTGSKHKTMLEARNGAGPIKSYPRSGSRLKLQNGSKGSGLQNKTFHCEVCDVHVNSEIQLKQHISSRRHKDRVAGKPMKPKYSPYNKLQRSPSILAAKLAFQKDILKPLAPTFLSSPLAAAVSSTFSFPPRPTSLFQAPTIPPALLRPGHGPIRATPAPILFAPY
ncbi:zinc finger protein 385B isoform X2 [Microcaecilia unicolor]|uniref:Zinc finger protein 385B n=1 Tax=Microcaecilia unicolor TaxID=1415580 RepID=A0A6P7YNH9_9AMPH|nr:zinc finger protein 385B isoform X2 [Microcaecilia unicolor]